MRSRSLKCSLIGTLALAAGVTVYGQTGPACVPPPASTFQSMSRAEIESLIVDVANTNPAGLERLKNDPDVRKDQIDGLRELLALASAAVKEGYAAKAVNCEELLDIGREVTAITYDVEKRKGKTGASFGLISDAMINGYWRGTSARPLSSALRKERETSFQEYVSLKLAIAAAGDPDLGDRTLSDAEVNAARDLYAKVRIYADEYKARQTALPVAFRNKVALQVKLQQTQFLAREYTATIAGKATASDEEIERFIAADPALSTASKRTKAEQIFARARNGEDFAALANEFSEDPGNKGEDGKLNGGLYSGVKKGIMVPEFEKAALASQPGQVYPALVETDFGFHIVKLENKDATNTYDVRHILISTMVKDPRTPDGRETPIKNYARSSVETAKQRTLIDTLVADSNVRVAEDFTFPGTAPAMPVTKAGSKPAAAKPTARRTVRKRH